MTADISSFKRIRADVDRSFAILSSRNAENQDMRAFVVFFKDITVHCETSVHFVTIVNVIPILFLVFEDPAAIYTVPSSSIEGVA